VTVEAPEPFQQPRVTLDVRGEAPLGGVGSETGDALRRIAAAPELAVVLHEVKVADRLRDRLGEQQGNL